MFKMTKTAEKVSNDTQRLKFEMQALVDRAINLDVSPFEDFLIFQPGFTEVSNTKWKYHWMAVLDTISLYYQGKGYNINIQHKSYNCSECRIINPIHGTLTYANIPHCKSSFKVYWKKIE